MKYSNFLLKLLCAVLIIAGLTFYQKSAIAAQKQADESGTEVESVVAWNGQTVTESEEPEEDTSLDTETEEFETEYDEDTQASEAAEDDYDDTADTDEYVTDDVAVTGADGTASDTADSGTWKDGSYEGIGQGYGGEIAVTVVIKSGRIASISTAAAEEENADRFTEASEVLSDIMIDQSLDVDTVTGATESSKGLIQAVGDALAQAKE